MTKTHYNHLKKITPDKVYKFTKDNKMYAANIKKCMVDNVTVQEIIDMNVELIQSNEKLEIEIKEAVDILSQMLRKENILIKHSKDNKETLLNGLKALQGTIILNPVNDYKHLHTNDDGVVTSTSNIRSYDGIINIDEVELQTITPKDNSKIYLTSGYIQVIDNKIIENKELKEKYKKTLKIGGKK